MIDLKTKKICFYTDSIFNLGGIQRVVTDLANNLYKDYDITVLCRRKINDNNKVDYNLNDNIRVDYLNEKSTILYEIFDNLIKIIRFILKRFIKIKLNSKLYEFFEFHLRISLKYRLKKYFLNNNYDYILAESISNCIYLSLVKNKINKNAKVIGCWHSSFDSYIQGYPRKLIEKSLKELDKTIVLSNYDKNQIKEKFNIDVEYIYNPIKEIIINKNINKEKKFIAVGRYSEEKGFDNLIKAFEIFNKENKEWKLEIVGEGFERKNLQNIIDEKKLNNYVKLVGQTDEIYRYYLSSSIFLMTSKVEGFGMVLVEAMQYKLPIVAFKVPVYEEILPKSVPLVKQGDITTFAKKMLELVENRNNINDMVEDYEVCLKKFYMNNIINKWKKVLK